MQDSNGFNVPTGPWPELTEEEKYAVWSWAVSDLSLEEGYVEFCDASDTLYES